MPKIAYEAGGLDGEKLDMCKHALRIIKAERANGYDVTLRQVYYQFVARDLFPEDRRFSLVDAKWVRDPSGTKNAEPNYKWLGCILGEARMRGVMDWEDMVDRTRDRESNLHFDNPAHRIQSAMATHRIDLWEGQAYRPEVWVEKDALVGVVAVACRRLDIPWFSCRGYTSLSSIWEGAQALKVFADDGVIPVILHIGDHDPSGIDMSRDIEDRVRMFMGDSGDTLEFKRLALNMDQIRRLKPPPSPAKPGDSRTKKYKARFGTSDSWELDALTPRQLDDLITDAVNAIRDEKEFAKRTALQKRERALLKAASDRWEDIAADMEQYIDEDGNDDE